MTDKENKQGGSGSGNSRQTYQIDHADVVAPSASTVENNRTVVIQLSFTICISGEFLGKMFHVLKKKFGTRWKMSFRPASIERLFTRFRENHAVVIGILGCSRWALLKKVSYTALTGEDILHIEKKIYYMGEVSIGLSC